MTVSKDELISVLRLRYDPYSAEAVYELSRQRAELPNDKTALDAKELAAFRAALAVVGDRVHLPLSRIDDMLAAPGAAASPEPVAKEDKKAKDKDRSKEHGKDQAKEAKDAAKDQSKDIQDTKAKDAKDAKGSNDGDKVTATTVVLSGVDVDDGDEILMCGGLPALGDWKPDKAKAMDRKGDKWSATIELAPDAEVAFKFVRRTAEGKLIWEDGADRQLEAKPRIEATWRD